MEIMNASLLLTFWIAGRLECLLLSSNGGGGPSDSVTPWPAPSGCFLAWLVVSNRLNHGCRVPYNIAGISCIWITLISGAVTSVYVPISEFWNFDIRYDIWNPEIRITPILQLRAVISVLVYPDITAGELRYQRCCDIRETPISQYLWCRVYSNITIPPISVVLQYHSTRYQSIWYREYSDITATPISQLQKIELRYRVWHQDIRISQLRLGSVISEHEFGKSPDGGRLV